MPLPRAEQFVEFVIFNKACGGQITQRYRTLISTWRQVQKFLNSAKIESSVACRNPELLFQYALRNQLSLDYTKKCCSMINWFEEFCSNLENRAAGHHEFPRGAMREKIRDAFRDSEKRPKNSEALTEESLLKSRSLLEAPFYNWLFLSFYLGLRPAEVDALKNPLSFKLNGDSISVYQAKLTQLPREQRWKVIPIYLEEQKVAIDIIQSGEFERPGIRLIHKVLGKEFHSYAGRKGFAQLLIRRGLDLEIISVMLGHSSIELTRKHYINPVDVQLERVRQLMAGIAK
jgi:hypothetical protein